jgi:hypothetical protein
VPFTAREDITKHTCSCTYTCSQKHRVANPFVKAAMVRLWFVAVFRDGLGDTAEEQEMLEVGCAWW